ncbi:MAG: helix-turn-helix transcriptional regulator [Clostridia bacterium]
MKDKVISRELFGKKIKEYRENLGYTQFALGDMIGVSQNFLGDIERGKKLPSLEVLVKLSNILKVSLDTLLSNSLDNIICEDESIVFTDKQLNIIKNLVKNINDNF